MSKVAVVTGGTSGIGRATALALKDAGYTVYELSRRAEGVEGLHHIAADVTDQQAVNDAAAQIMEAEGRIDVLVATTIIESGIDENDEIIVEGQNKVRVGQAVAPEETTREALEQAAIKAASVQHGTTDAKK